MPYLHIIQNLDINSKNREELLREFDALRSELDDLRTQYAALLAKMDADFANVTGAETDYAASVPLAASTFTRT